MPTALFVHNGSPGRFAFIASALAERGWRCALLNGPEGRELPGVATRRWKLHRGSTEGIFPPATKIEADFLRGKAAAEVALGLRSEGFVPDVIIGHPGWGEMLFLGEVFPEARQIQLGEFYYRSKGADVDFDPEFGPVPFEEQLLTHAKNAGLALSYAAADKIVVPTPFQAGLLPEVFQRRVTIIHEGVDTTLARRRPGSALVLNKSLTLDGSKPVITFVNRFFEPVRGFHIFMRALPSLLQAVPEAHVLLIGSEKQAGYGIAPASNTTWKEVLLKEVGAQLPPNRIHFLGQISYEHLITVFSISTAHVYLTYPFVLSWSLLDAMACECLVVASDTSPVRDVIVNNRNGMLVNFFDHRGLASAIAEVCRSPKNFDEIRRAARDTILNSYDRRQKSRAWVSLVEEVTRPR